MLLSAAAQTNYCCHRMLIIALVFALTLLIVPASPTSEGVEARNNFSQQPNTRSAEVSNSSTARQDRIGRVQRAADSAPVGQSIDPRNLPSPLPAAKRKQQKRKGNSATARMRADGTSPLKRSAASDLSPSAATGTISSSNEQKRFRTSGRFAETTSGNSSTTSSQHHHQSRTITTSNDMNNNDTISGRRQQQQQSNDMNNNSIDSGAGQATTQTWRQNVNSVNGTVDLTQYSQSDVDRLYGDALLVYFKNFNETLPARRETININGTHHSRIPIYRSVSSNE